jgi:hypothetical protein
VRSPAEGERPLYWVGSAKRDLLLFPETVQDEMGTALSVAQFGGKHPIAKPWKVAGAGVYWRSSRIMTETPIVQSTPSIFAKRSMSCTVSRKNRTEALRRQGQTWNSSFND